MKDVQFGSDYIAALVFLGVFALLADFIFGGQPRRQWTGGGRRWKRGQMPPFRAEAPAMSDPAIQLTYVMNASFKKRRILNNAEARVFFAVEKALEQTDTGWRVMAQVNLGEILMSDDKHAFMAVNSKRVDMLVIGADGAPIAAIEYQRGRPLPRHGSCT